MTPIFSRVSWSKLVDKDAMKVIGAFEARTYFSTLLDRVAKGERITITRRGIPVAMLTPVGHAEQKLSHKAIVEGMRSLRKRVKPGSMTVRDMISEGRRF